jgi:dUTP pyrophosphatase
MYSTGLQIEPPNGLYFEIVPRSSIIKSGYIQANGIGVVDSGYRGELFVPLYKLDKDSPDLELPKKIGQLVLREIITCEFIETDELHKSHRGSGGFGSTDRFDDEKTKSMKVVR